MRKRIIAVLLCLCICLGFVPQTPVSAMTNDQYRERHRIMKQIGVMHQTILERNELETMKGLCGMMVSWELYLLEINDYVIAGNGNEFFDMYAEMDQTTGGYPVHAYPATDYSLEEALYTITKGGTEDVYNVLVGFDWTNTDDGKMWGHVCMIHAIIDGYVYFMEGFDIYGFKEGEAVIMEISSFVNYWETWTRYEGTIYFGNKRPEDYSSYYSTDMYLQTEAPLPITKGPDHEAQQLRKTVTGERLHAVGLHQTKSGSWFYKVVEGTGFAFVPASGTKVIWRGFEDVRTNNLKLPKKLRSGQKFNVSGKIRVPLLELEGVWITVTDADGKVLKDRTIDKNGKYCNLEYEEALDLSDLAEGVYTYNVYADLRNNYVADDVLQYESKTVPVMQQLFTVGEAVLPEEQTTQEPKEKELPDSGWILKDDIWYYLENGKPRTGWFCSGGVNYYLKEDGSVTTGWAEIGGIQRYFTDTGALRVGWMENGKQTHYLLRNGVRATGWKIVDGGRYYLGDDGVLRKKGWLEQDGKLYYVDETGRACVGWVDLREGRFSFHADGYLLARMVGEEIVEYDGTWRPYLILK